MNNSIVTQAAARGQFDSGEDGRAGLSALSAASFWIPDQLLDSAWVEHAPFAFWLVDALRPAMIVELGTHNGYSYLTFCQAVERLNVPCQCFAVDTWLGDEHAGFYGEEVFSNLQQIHDQRYGTFSQLLRSRFDEALPYFSDGSIDLLHIDGRHSYDDVKQDFESWVPKLSARAIVLLHDTNVRERGFGVWRLWEEVRAKHPSFEFFHGHGLGVLGIGVGGAVALRDLFKTAGAVEAETRSAYANLGASVANRYLTNYLLGEENARNKALVELRAEKAAARRELARAERADVAHAKTLRRLNQTIEQAARDRESHAAARHLLAQEIAGLRSLAGRLSAIETSSSWRLTLPLRRFFERNPNAARVGRRALKLAWWTATGQTIDRFRDWKATRGATSNSSTREGGLKEVSPGHLNSRVEASATPTLAAESAAVLHFDDTYALWCALNEPDSEAFRLQARISRCLERQPLFCVLVPVFRTPVDVFCEMVSSVIDQTYCAWELCLAIVDEGEPSKFLIEAAEEFVASEPRIRIRRLAENFGISGNSNITLEMATGDWSVLLDHDDLLSRDALFEMARAVNAHPNAGFIYSDKDSIDRSGRNRFNPLFKPQWSPEIMLNANYLTHLCAMRTGTLRQIGGWDPGTDGAQDWCIFLRIIGAGGTVVHIDRVLYHWRWIETSVAAGGYLAKPYALEGQIRALAKYLPNAGWPGARAYLDGPNLRIEWAPQRGPSISAIVVGGEHSASPVWETQSNIVDVVVARGYEIATAVDDAIERSEGEIVVLLDRDYVPAHSKAIDELALPLANPDLAFVAGRVADTDGKIVDYGVIFQDGAAYPAFRSEPLAYYGIAGGAGWYRNASGAAGGALAFRKSTWKALGGFHEYASSRRCDIAFVLEGLHRGLGRLMLNPYAEFVAQNGPCAFEKESNAPMAASFILDKLPHGDPYINPNLDVSVPGAPRLRLPTDPSPSQTPGHDFFAQAREVASAFDVTRQEVDASIAACASEPSGALRRAIWIIPDFRVAFYGGINTILRTAEYMRTRYGVMAVFVVYDENSAASAIRARIGEAFPDLAVSCDVIVSRPSEALPYIGPADAAICTLWTTAYPLLRLRGIRRKFYFVQDWEPQFYPSGTLSTVVEATYRFGFFAVCNTRSLAESYRQLGGEADYFLPAVDRRLFHARSRAPRKPGDPFVLVAYGRPGTPRNCFESLCEGLKLLKGKFGADIEIVTVGSDWDAAQFGLEGVVRNLGLLPYTETAALYRAADAGLAAMATRHPSYLPFEWMACGAAVVTNKNIYTSWLLRDGDNSLLCEMTKSDIFDTVSRLVNEPGLRDAVAAKALEDISVSHNDWAVPCEHIYAAMSRICEHASSRKGH